jgi:hypothetical protein
MVGIGLNWWQSIIVIAVSQTISSAAMFFNSRFVKSLDWQIGKIRAGELTALPDVLVYTTSDILLLQEVSLECTEATTLLAPELHWQSFGMVYNVSSLEHDLFLPFLPY